MCLDNTKLNSRAIEELQKFSEAEISDFRDSPETDEEILNRIGDAQAVILSWRTQLGEEILQKCPDLKYIGLACSLYDDESSNVAVKFAQKNGVEVTGIFDYGDPGVVEFITSELIRLLHGFGKQQWKEDPVELTNRKIGIVGLGTTGQMLAECLLPFNANLYYYSRTRKPGWEQKGLKYLELPELLKTTEILSFHLPKNTSLMGTEEFNLFGKGKIFINTSLGLPFEESAFQEWIKKEGNFAIFDGDGGADLSEETQDLPGLIHRNKSAGWSAETRERLSRKVVDNVKDFLGS